MKIAISLLFFLPAAALFYFRKQAAVSVRSAAAGYAAKTRALLDTSYTAIKNNEVLQLQAAVFLLFAALSILAGQLLVMLAAVPVMFTLPKYYVDLKRKEYVKKYAQNLPSFLEAVISNMKAGASLAKAIQSAAERDKSPVGREMEIALHEASLGKSFQDALLSLSERVKIRENEIMITAIITASETGGSITEILSGILITIRKRDELNREMKAMTSQGVLSGIIVGMLPVFLVAAVSFLDPEFMKPLFTTNEGAMILAAAVAMELAGAYFIKKTVEIN